jgi:catechol 2,3-dioxygenase-like lactoylglutathione lyase family enzyme
MTRILENHYVLAVPEADASSSFYRDVLGFREVFAGDGWRFVRRENCTIILGACPDAIPASELGDHSYFAYLVVTIADRPWGMREFGIRTPDGHRIMIAHDMGETTTNEEEEC